MFKEAAHHDAIESLKEMVSKRPGSDLCEKIMQKCMQKRIQPPQAESLEGKAVAYYIGEAVDTHASEEIFAQIQSADARAVRFDREMKRSGASLLGANNRVAYKKAATTLLDALDSGADTLICADEKALGFFREHLGMMQKEIGREIQLSLVSLPEFKALLTDKEAVA
jgi:hypothetical protein